MKYEPIPELSKDEIARIINEQDMSLLHFVPLAVSFHAHKWDYAQAICISLTTHENEYVRGNSMLGLGYIGMFKKVIDREKVQPILERALQDKSEYVRGHAICAIDDINHHLGWGITHDQKD